MRRWGMIAWAVTISLVPGCFIDRSGTAGGRMDAGGDAPSCVAVAETCNGADDDCDMRTDEDFDLTSDRNHCGSCGTVCPSGPANGSSSCVASACELVCDAGFEDCDGDVANGCEENLSDPATCGTCDTACGAGTPFCSGDPPSCIDMCPVGTTDCGGSCVDTTDDALHCGGCGMACAEPANASPTCVRSACDFSCDSGFDDCAGGAADGCEAELATDPANCGRCDNACSDPPNASGSCDMGSCELTCDPNFGDCDGGRGNGCETDLRDDISSCGSCGSACPGATNATATCTSRVCGFVCSSGFADCDRVPGNGCEVNTETDPANCGACSTVCPAGSCSSGSCGMCPGTSADCDMDPSNGCEADLLSVDTCRSCSTECAIWESCVSFAGCSSPCSACGATCTSMSACCEETCSGASCSVTHGDRGCRRVIDCRDKTACSVDCTNRSRCLVDCRRTGTCDFQCSDGGTICAMDCRGATSCNMQCSANNCVLRCDIGAGASCQITSCTSPVFACPDGEYFTCGAAACP